MKNIFHNRISILRGELSLKDGEGFFTSTREDVLYLTGFDSTNSNLIITKDVLKIFTDQRYTQQLTKLSYKIESEFIKNSFLEHLKNFCSEKKIHTIYFEPSKFSFQRVYELKKIKSVKVKPLKKDISFIFARADSYSITQTKKAISITEKIFNQILNQIREDISERDLKAELKFFIHKEADGEAFDPIVLFGRNTAYPHGVSSNKKLKKNSPVLIDFGVKVSGYNSDFTRTIYFGNPTKDFIKKYEIVKSALRIAIEEISANTKSENVALKVLKHFEKFDVDENFTHALGHGIGIYLHNFPRISYKSNQLIPDNVILAIEPALYFENQFGIRIEQDILLFEGRKEILTKTTDELIIL